MLHQQFWRKWHRWIGFVAAVFLIWVAVTGVIISFTEFFGEDERLREATRGLVSPVTTRSPAAAAWADPIARALAAVDARHPGAPIDKLEVQFKGPQPTVTVFTGKPTGGEDRQLVVSLKTGALLREEAYEDKPFLNRLHSGEAFGDGGLVAGMLWGTALVLIAITGSIMYVHVLRRAWTRLHGVRRVFW